MELTKNEQKFLKECRGEGGRLPAYFWLRSWGPLIITYITSWVGIYAFRHMLQWLGFALMLVSGYAGWETQVLYKTRVLTNKLANRIEELERKK